MEEKVLFEDIEEESKEIVKKIVDKFLVDKVYNSNDIGWITDHLTKAILAELSLLSENFKYILTLVLVQNENSGFSQNSSLYFDTDTDGLISEKLNYPNITCIYNLYCLAI